MKKILVGNLKMNLTTITERSRYLQMMKKSLANSKFSDCELVLCPPYVHLEAFKDFLGKKVFLGSQNVFSEDKGSFTGEISPLMLKNLGCGYAICGHSERRRFFSETNEEVSMKVVRCLKNGIIPIVCIGEKKEEKDDELTMEVITRQVTETLSVVSRSKIESVVVVYEPVWAVGSDIVPSSNEIMGAKLLIRKILTEMYSKNQAEKIRIIYGGSVNAQTIVETCIKPGMDGVLVGRESLIPQELVRMAKVLDNS